MELREFHNGLRVLAGLDMSELVAGGVIEADDEAEWKAFREHPWKWLITADDDRAVKLWAVMKGRGA